MPHTIKIEGFISPIWIDGGGGRSMDAVVIDVTETPVDMSVEWTLKESRHHEIP